MQRRKAVSIAASTIVIISMLAFAWDATAQDAKPTYPNMAPLEQYLIQDRDSEIEPARSAAPEAIARDAEIMVLGRNGYQAAIQGKNGFVCMVLRSWTAPLDDPNFWNPKLRGPACFNAAAARSYVPRVVKKTELLLAGRTKTQMIEAVAGAIDNKQLPPLEPGAMCYMLSQQGYLSERAGHRHPHLMFFYSARTHCAAVLPNC